MLNKVLESFIIDDVKIQELGYLPGRYETLDFSMNSRWQARVDRRRTEFLTAEDFITGEEGRITVVDT